MEVKDEKKVEEKKVPTKVCTRCNVEKPVISKNFNPYSKVCVQCYNKTIDWKKYKKPKKDKKDHFKGPNKYPAEKIELLKKMKSLRMKHKDIVAQTGIKQATFIYWIKHKLIEIPDIADLKIETQKEVEAREKENMEKIKKLKDLITML